MKFGITINDLRANAIIGILPTERTKAQKIAVDLEAVYEVDLVDCAKSDTHPLAPSAREGESIVDYAILREIILDSFKHNNFFYLESALVAIQGAILEKFPQILELNLSVKKLAIFSDCVPKVRLSWKKSLDGCFTSFANSTNCHNSARKAQNLAKQITDKSND